MPLILGAFSMSHIFIVYLHHNSKQFLYLPVQVFFYFVFQSLVNVLGNTTSRIAETEYFLIL